MAAVTLDGEEWQVLLFGVVIDGQHILVIGVDHFFNENSRLYMQHREHVVTFAQVPTEYVTEHGAAPAYNGLQVTSGRFFPKALRQYQDGTWSFDFREIDPLAVEKYSFEQAGANEIYVLPTSERPARPVRRRRRRRE
jgi:hypothetical protein